MSLPPVAWLFSEGSFPMVFFWFTVVAFGSDASLFSAGLGWPFSFFQYIRMVMRKSKS